MKQDLCSGTSCNMRVPYFFLISWLDGHKHSFVYSTYKTKYGWVYINKKQSLGFQSENSLCSWPEFHHEAGGASMVKLI